MASAMVAAPVACLQSDDGRCLRVYCIYLAVSLLPMVPCPPKIVQRRRRFPVAPIVVFSATLVAIGRYSSSSSSLLSGGGGLPETATTTATHPSKYGG